MYSSLLAVVAVLLTQVAQCKPTSEPNPQKSDPDILPYEPLNIPFEVGTSLNLAEVPAGTPCYPETGGRNGKKRQLDPCDDSSPATQQPENSNQNGAPQKLQTNPSEQPKNMIQNTAPQQLRSPPSNNKQQGTIQDLLRVNPQNLRIPDILEEKQDPFDLLRGSFGPLLGKSASGCDSSLVAVCGPVEDDDERIPFDGKTLWDAIPCGHPLLPHTET
ncbi:hypothetical protein MMC22_011979 [Lobaria immixta]|nr:hypothetical protein [Lobaria immixta]